MIKYLLIFLLPTLIYSQKFYYEREFGEFNFATNFSMSPLGILYVTDSGNSEVYALDTLGNFLKEIGGFGWELSQFDNPINVYADGLRVYVTDQNNHRIQIFDRELNFLTFIKTKESRNNEEAFGYPIDCVASSQGDIFVIDSEAMRIVKFDALANYSMNFGGFESGSFAINKPKDFTFSKQNILVVLDEKNLLFFDTFGTGIIKIPLPKKFNSVKTIADNLLLTSDDAIYLGKIVANEIHLIKLDLSGDFENTEFISALSFNNKLYLLTSNNILVFNAE